VGQLALTNSIEHGAVESVAGGAESPLPPEHDDLVLARRI
jgi:hypothetical protein